MTDLRTAAQQALEALDCPGKAKTADEQAAITALRAALAEPNYWEEEARRYASNADYWRKRCVSCGGALPATGQDDRTGECVCGEPTALNTVHRTDGPCYVAEPVQEPVRPYPFKLLTEEEAAYLSAKRSKFANGVKTSCEAEAKK